MRKYDYRKIESKWQEEWERNGTTGAEDDSSRRKFYVLNMFPYPSGAGLHVGHVESYAGADIIVRKRRMEGWNVLFPMGWDAFGLPAENYAIKSGVHPAESTAANIDNFRRQMKSLGFAYDWPRETNTSDPAYYRWTQWLFLLFYKNGLAYRDKAPVNWCDSCQTVLANEQVEGGACERCKNEVVQKDLEQWFLRITEFSDRLLDGLDGIDWPEKIKAMQRNWIGRSEGVEIVFRSERVRKSESEKDFSISVFTTRVDTLFGVSCVVLAPEHPLVKEIVTDEHRATVGEYVKQAQGKSELERTGTELDKTGVPTGATVKHPFTGEDIPVWIADYVLATYGTGAVMCVPAHDERDYGFAEKYGLEVKEVVVSDGESGKLEAGSGKIVGGGEGEKGRRGEMGQAFIEKGRLVDSGEFSGLTSEEAIDKMVEALASKKLGEKKVNYHLRDWLISRQRYWGPPIPIIYCDKCGEVPVPEKDLPVLLPDDVDFNPTGESPLTASKTFHDVKCPKCGGDARRESDTMDTFVDSSWYFLRYCSPHDGEHAFSSHDVARWCPVDLYIGGAEHAVLHLLYSRFFTMVLYDAGLIPFEEPFLKLINQGMVLGEGGEKMSKSKGNVINPDDVAAEHGADSLRMYEMFMGEFEDAKPWDTQGIVGVDRFLDKVWMTVHDVVHTERPEADDALDRLLHKTVRKVSEDIEAFKFNTAISAMMIFLNEWSKSATGGRETAGTFLKLLAPYAPHIAEELWHELGNEKSIALEEWPKWDEALTKDEVVTLVIQVNGKLRDSLEVAAGEDEERVKEMALANEKVKGYIEGKEVKRIVVIQDKIINIVV
ncbi:MAG: leucine--tRNA ligase [Patescibacteria group bacterium]|nr:leucine--tRNA ligase [Patescibacteria group bacterium]